MGAAIAPTPRSAQDAFAVLGQSLIFIRIDAVQRIGHLAKTLAPSPGSPQLTFRTPEIVDPPAPIPRTGKRGGAQGGCPVVPSAPSGHETPF